MTTHRVGETVLVLDPATLTRTSSLDEVGLTRFYRAVSIGADPSLPEAVAFTNEAARTVPARQERLEGEAPHTNQGVRHIGGKQRLARAVEAHHARRPISGQPVQVLVALAPGLTTHGGKAGRQLVNHLDDLDPHFPDAAGCS